MQLDAAHRKLNLYQVLMAAVIAAVVSGAAYGQPELRVSPAPRSVTEGEAFRVSYEISWTGSPSDYTVLPAEVEPLDWGTCTLLPSKAYVRDGRNVIVQEVEFVANQLGEVQIPAVEFQYLRPEDVQKPEKPDTPMHLNVSDAPPKLRADPFPLLVQPHTTPAWLFGVLGALFLFVLLYVGWRIRRSSRRAAASVATPQTVDHHAVRSHLNTAKRLRLEGDFYGAYRELAAAGEHVQSRDPELSKRLARKTENVGYRGLRPTEDEMDGDVRAIERAMAAEETIPRT